MVRRGIHPAHAALIGGALGVALLSGCTPSPPAPPPAGAVFDYQLGAPYEPDVSVDVVVRDRTASPAEGMYSICYVNAFQTQPGELGDWPDELLLRDAAGDVMFDPDWPDEALVDTSDAEAVVAVVGPWIRGCADDGFAAVEFDNLDTYSRARGLLERADAVVLARRLVDVAHAAGLAAAQKNAAEDTAVLHASAHFDFAIAEECGAYRECDAYTDVYGDDVLAIEYTDNLTGVSFDEVCADPEHPRSIILRDRALGAPDDEGYTFRRCS